MSISIALGEVLVRALIASVVGSAALVLATLAGALGGGGSGGIVIAAFVIFFGAAWSILPAVRQSRALAAIVVVAWWYLGLWLYQLGPHAGRWLLGPWLLASICVLANPLLARTKSPEDLLDKRAQCDCCDFFTLSESERADVCPVCYWTRDTSWVVQVGKPSTTNAGVTLKEARQNFLSFGACASQFKASVLSDSEWRKFRHAARK